MTSTSLRAYNHEIESMIEQGQAEEGIAHCIHILQSVPKHIGTYRLLGKALLELQRYTDAADIFQRVLSSVPDDFVSHVGMSIIRENERNLDGAIWHMERAFEAQPANAAIQDELRRLYGRRDGMEPPKIRLTRGALSRMYAKGHLYLQAVGELQAALAEDTKRPDLQVLLAQMYHRSGQREQAVKVCNDLIKILPHCLEANRILADLIPGGASGADTQNYFQRLVSLDPYYSKIGPGSTSSDRVPENIVVVDRLNYQAGQNLLSSSSQPAWAQSLGVSFPQSSEEALPDWQVDSEVNQGKRIADEIQPPIGEETQSDLVWESQSQTMANTEQSKADIMPDFLKEAGWSPSDRSADEIAMEELKKEQETQTGNDIAAAEIPEWLREMAPKGVLDEGVNEIETENLPWLQETEPGPTDSVITWLQETKQPPTAEEIEDLQSALKAASEVQAEPVPDWITGPEPELPRDAQQIPSPDLVEEQEIEAEETQIWAQIPQISTPETPEANARDIEAAPDWLHEISQVEPSEELPAWLQETPEAAQPAEEIPDWLRSLETETPMAEAPAAEQEMEATGLVFETYAEAVPAREELPVAEAPADETITWIATPPAVEEALEPVEAVEDAAQAIEAEELPAWLQETPEAAQPAEQIPGWLRGIEAETPGEEKPTTELEKSVEIPASQPAAAGFNLEDEDTALAWLESLAQQQGAAADQLTTRPEDRPETPEWLITSAQEADRRGEIPTYEPTETVEGLAPKGEAEAAPAQAELPEEMLAEEAAPVEAVPDWLAAPTEELPVAEAPADETITWIATPPAVEEALEPVEAVEDAAQAIEKEELPAWLQETPEAAQPAEQIPDWLRGIEAETPGEETPVEELVEASELWEPEIQAELSAKEQPVVGAEAVKEQPETELPEWLKEPEIDLFDDTKPTIISLTPEEKAPDWVLGNEPVIEMTPSEPVGEPALEDEVPAWLLEEEEEPEPISPVEAESEEIPEWIIQPEEEETVSAMPWETEEEPTEVEIPLEATLEKLDLNSASLAELEDLPGIGFILAQNIINFREASGPFSQLDDMVLVDGISPTLVDELRDFVEVGGLPVHGSVEEQFIEPEGEDEIVLMQARNNLVAGELSSAIEQFKPLISKQVFLPEIIRDLQEALYQQSENLEIWETLGDAYMRNDQLQEALEAYTRAEELLI